MEAVICPTKSHFETPWELRLRHCEYTWRPIVASRIVAAVQPINTVRPAFAGRRPRRGQTRDVAAKLWEVAHFRLAVPNASLLCGGDKRRNRIGSGKLYDTAIH